MRRLVATGLLLCLLAATTACLSLCQARSRYAATQDYRSLKRIARALETGMARAEVERILGEPVAHPGNGQYCYLSDREEQVGDFQVPVALVVNYNDAEGRETDRLQGFFFVAMAE